MKRTIILAVLLMCFGMTSSFAQSSQVKRVILFIIDGINVDAPAKLKMPVFNELAKKGTYIPEEYVLVPNHPTVGAWRSFSTCSFPNPLMQQGTLFFKPENKMVQELFPTQQTAMIANAIDYRSLARGFSTAIQDVTMTDEDVVNSGISILQSQNPVYMRLHLQASGTRGYEISQASEDKPYCRNIYGEGSPYVKAIENADRCLGKFVAFMKKNKMFDNTVLVVTADHGENLGGWHSLFDPEAWRTPMIWVGAGIAEGRVLSYFEQTDLAPTIAGLLGKDGPNHDGACGVFVKAILKDVDASTYHPAQYLKKFDEQISEFNTLRAELISKAKVDDYYCNMAALLENGTTYSEPFYHQDRVMEWYKAGTIQHMLEANENVLACMRQALSYKINKK
jgi:hypothetical protein